MSDPIIGAVVTQLLEIVERQIRENIKLVKNVDEEIEKLKSTFESIHFVILDAEKKQVKEFSIRLWVQRLRDVAYELDDVLAEWSTALFKIQRERPENNTPKEKVFSFITFPCFCFGRIIERRDIALKIKVLNQRLDQIDDEKKKYSFSVIPSSNESIEKLHTTSYVKESEVQGRKNEKFNLVKELLKKREKKGLNIVSLVGMGGIGKTTLAQVAYNSSEVSDHFEMKSWVVVSESFDVVRIAKAIVENIENKAPELYELETILRRLREIIKGKRYLLVLDDAWTDDISKWEHLISSLGVGDSGSTLLVTTRNEKVARIIHSNEIITLPLLSDDDCWELFRQYAFSGRSNDEDLKHLERIGREIANKCKGLPLAAKTIGCLMSFKTSVDDWRNVLESDTWNLQEADTDKIFPPLLLSYYDLLPPWRRCFSFCAIFPKDTEIEAETLIKLWMANGYLISKGNADMEAIGREYLNNLAMRCFFQDLKRDKVSDNIMQFKMHDMVHDLAQYLTKNECSTMETDSKLISVHDLAQYLTKNECSTMETDSKLPRGDFRHLTLVRSQDVSFPSIEDTTKLHTFWVQSFYDCPELVNDLDKFSPEFFDHLSYLKVFDISRNRFQELPKEIGQLLNLRYLNLSHNPLSELPETVCELFNLQTLKLVACKHLERLPQGIGKLENLRHLEMDHTDRLKKLPKGIGKLNSLQTLSKVVLSSFQDDPGTCNLGDLKDLNQLRGSLKIEGLGYATNVADAKKAELKKKQLVDLHMDFKTLSVSSRSTEDVVEALELHCDLKFLTMSFYGGAKLPSWIISLNSLRILKLLDCRNCNSLPPLGKLQSLETLSIENMHGVTKIGAEFLGIEGYSNNGARKGNWASVIDVFPSLKKLKLQGMSRWEEWDFTSVAKEVEDGKLRIMPCLKYLKLSGCINLKELPEILLRNTPIRKPRIRNCPFLEPKYGSNSGEQWPKSKREVGSM